MIVEPVREKPGFLIIPILYWLVLILVFNLVNTENSLLFLKKLPGYDVWIRLLMFVLIPVLIFKVIEGRKFRIGFNTSVFGNSLSLALKGWAITGPIGAIAFGIVLFLLEMDINSWSGSLLITIGYVVALVIIIPIIGRHPDYDHELEKKNRSTVLINLIILFGVLSVFLKPSLPILSGIFIYIFIVGFGEEILFRGFLQTSLNIFLKRPFKIRGIEFGYGLIITALLFGLTHALVLNPFEWQRATFTTIGGLIFGLIREKENSIMACGMLHAFMDLPKLLVTEQ